MTVTAATRSVVLVAETLDLSRLGRRVRCVVPDGLAGPVCVSVRRVAGWDTQPVLVRLAGPGVAEFDADPAVSLGPDAEALADLRGLSPGEELAVGADAAESGAAVLVEVRAAVAVTDADGRPALGVNDRTDSASDLARGTLPSARLGTPDRVLVGVKTADESRVSTITPAADAEVRVPVEAGAVYTVDMILKVNADVAADFKFSLSVPGSGDLFITATATKAASPDTFPQSVNGAGADRLTIEHGLLVTDTAGELVLLWSQNSSNINATTLRRGSYLKLRRLA